jgi:hypothetical protein
MLHRLWSLLGIDLLYSIGPKGHIYIHVQVCKYAGNPLTGGENTIYKYTSNTPPPSNSWWIDNTEFEEKEIMLRSSLCLCKEIR